VRSVTELDDADADAMVAAAIQTARRLGIGVSVAVVDRGGRLKRFARMDEAEIAGATLAEQKAFSAIANSCDTDVLAGLAQPGADLYGIEAAGSGAFTVVIGGVVVRHRDEIVGAIGVSGGTSDQDRACAIAGRDAVAGGEST
jgi:uncharacterized protein GlcG (DUF336 family)